MKFEWGKAECSASANDNPIIIGWNSDTYIWWQFAECQRLILVLSANLAYQGVGNETVVWEPLVNAIRREYFSLRDSNKLKCRHIVPFYELI